MPYGGNLGGSIAKLAKLTDTGIVVHTSATEWAARTITGTANQVVVSDGGGITAAPTLSTPQDLDTGAAFQVGSLDVSDGDITSVGSIALDSIAADGTTITIGGTPSIVVTDGTTIALSLGTDAGDDFSVGGTSLVVEGDTGRLGMGTASPATQVHATTSAANIEFRLESTNASGRCIFRMLADNGEDSVILFGDQDNTARGRIRYEHSDDSIDLRTAGTDNRLVIDSAGDVSIGGISAGSAGAQLDVDQALTSGAQPVLRLDQADKSEEFVRLEGTADAGNITRSIVAETDVTTATRAGFVQFHVVDQGGQITDQKYYVPIFTLA